MFFPKDKSNEYEKLQRRGLFRTEYEGWTLRQHLGWPRPVNQFSKIKANPEPVAV